MQVKIEVNSKAYGKLKKEIKEFEYSHEGINYSLKSFNSFQVLPESQNLSNKLLDLMNLINIVLLIDRFTRRGKKINTTINLKFPVLEFDFWLKKATREKLVELLTYFTELNWNLEFYKDNFSSPYPNQKLEFISNEEKEICLWSGGLDALAGLINRIKEFPDKKFILASFESNPRKKHSQRVLFDKLNKIHPNIQERIYIHNIPNHKQKKEYPYARTRGLFFLMSGLILAYTLNQKKLFLYENGIGALNLMLPGNIGLDQSITSTFESFHKCSEFFEIIVDKRIKIENPFAFKTKTEMCKTLNDSIYQEIIFKTNSCDGPHRNKPSECGYCTSCILRRLSLFNANIEDKTSYVTHNIGNLIEKKEYNSMEGQFIVLKEIIERDDMQELFRQQADLYNSQEFSGLSKKDFESNMKNILKSYINEFESFHELIEKSYQESHTYQIAS